MANLDKGTDSHYHGLRPNVVNYVLTAVRHGAKNVEFKVGESHRDPFIIATVELPTGHPFEDLGTVPCDLRGPIVGDAPIAEAEVTYQVRPGVSYRPWESRIVNLPPKTSRLVTVIAGEGGIMTMFGGPLSPQETGDPSAHDPTGCLL